MNPFRTLPSYLLISGILVLIALIFLTCFRGYTWIALTFLFAAVLVMLHHFLPASLWRAVMILVCIGLMYFSALELLIVGAAGGDKDADSRYIVVLGAAVFGDRPSLALTHRLEGALDYLETRPGSIAILSGGQGGGEDISEAQCMHDWLLARGIDESRLIMEDKSASTKQNLENSFALIRARGDEPSGNTTLVSSSYHLYRAKRIAANIGVSVCAVPGNPGYPVYMLNCFIREAFGVTQLIVFGS